MNTVEDMALDILEEARGHTKALVAIRMKRGQAKDPLHYADIESFWLEVGAIMQEGFDLMKVDIEDQIRSDDRRDLAEMERAAQRGTL